MRHEFHPEALDEYEDAARYYASHQDGLELRFIDCAELAFRKISEAPTRCSREPGYWHHRIK